MSRFVDRRPLSEDPNVVWARDAQRDGAVVVLHRFALTPARAAALRARLREAAKVAHPNLVPMVAIGEEDDAVLLARAWIDGRALTGRLGERAAIQAAIDVLEGLAAAHEGGLAHGAVSPAMVFGAADGSAVLVGLGFEGRGSPAGDLRAVAALLEGWLRHVPAPLEVVLSTARAGGFVSAGAMAEALRALPPPRATPWSRPAPWIAAVGLVLLVVVLGWALWGGAPGATGARARPIGAGVGPAPELWVRCEAAGPRLGLRWPLVALGSGLSVTVAVDGGAPRAVALDDDEDGFVWPTAGWPAGWAGAESVELRRDEERHSFGLSALRDACAR